jgi:hypothetical protein
MPSAGSLTTPERAAARRFRQKGAKRRLRPGDGSLAPAGPSLSRGLNFARRFYSPP